MKADDADVFLSSALLRLNKTGSAIDADDEASSDFRVKSSAVTCLVNSITWLVCCFVD